MKEYLNKIINADCLDALKNFPDSSVDCVITSPPYNKNSADRKCSKSDSWSNANIDYGSYKDNLPEHEYQEWQKDVIRECVRVLKVDGSLFYNHKYRIVNHRVISPEEWLGEFILRQVIIWNRKSSPILEPIRFMPTIEQIYWITKEQKTPYFTREGFQFKDVWDISPARNNTHPAPFPTQIAERCIIASCPPDGVVLDPFMGSGTTAIACIKTGRNYVGIEREPKFIKLINTRINNELSQYRLII